jgi:hypothetical protein
MKFMSPAEYVIYCFKGVRATARAIGRDPSSVVKWPMPRSRKGSDGKVPHRAQPLILRAAEERELDLTAQDLIVGRFVDE